MSYIWHSKRRRYYALKPIVRFCHYRIVGCGRIVKIRRVYW
jgi:hypothetical protein